MHSNKVKATAKKVGLLGTSLSSSKPTTAGASKQERDQRKQDREKQRRGLYRGEYDKFADKAKNTTKY